MAQSKQTKSVNPVNIVHQHGIPVGAMIDGKRVERLGSIFVDIPGIMKPVPTAPYDNHFVYATNKIDSSGYMCTCGSPAVVVRTNAASGKYGAALTDPTAVLMMVCLCHASTGRHSNAS